MASCACLCRDSAAPALRGALALLSLPMATLTATVAQTLAAEAGHSLSETDVVYLSGSTLRFFAPALFDALPRRSLLGTWIFCFSPTAFWLWQVKPAMIGPVRYLSERRILSRAESPNERGAFR